MPTVYGVVLHVLVAAKDHLPVRVKDEEVIDAAACLGLAVKGVHPLRALNQHLLPVQASDTRERFQAVVEAAIRLLQVSSVDCVSKGRCFGV